VFDLFNPTKYAQIWFVYTKKLFIKLFSAIGFKCERCQRAIKNLYCGSAPLTQRLIP